jgi:hypothetical protein
MNKESLKRTEARIKDIVAELNEFKTANILMAQQRLLDSISWLYMEQKEK